MRRADGEGFVSRLSVALILIIVLLATPHDASAACTFTNGESAHPVFKTNAGLQFCPDGDNWSTILASGAGVPGGSTGHIQFNNAGAFAGDANLFWDNTNKRLGIGTTSPTHQLHATGGLRANTVQIGQNDGAGVDMAYPYESVGTYATAANLRLQSGQHILFHTGMTTSEADDNSKTRMMITNTGNVGIGTANPGARLVVSSPSATDVKLRIDANGDEYAGLVIENGQQDWLWQVTKSTDTPAGRLRLWNAGEKVTILPSGNVGIGATSPTGALHIKASGAQADAIDNGIALLRSASGDYQIQITNASGGVPHIDFSNASNEDFDARIVLSSNDELRIEGANLVVSGTGTTCSIGNGTGATNCTSDLRLKDRIEPVDGALDKLLQIKGVTFHWKDPAKAGPEHLGVIAQDVEKVFPQAITTLNDHLLKDAMAVDYAVLVAPMIEAIRELKAANDNLRALVERQGEEIEALKATLH